MHELALVEEILGIVTDASGGRPVRRVVLEVGKLSAVLPDAVRFCFDLVTADTVAEGARLDIVETPGLGRCRACGGDVQLDGPLGRCAGCGGIDLDWITGEELRITSVEVA